MSDYVAYLIFPSQLLLILLLKERSLLKRWGVGLLISLILIIFWIPVFLSQISIGLNISKDIPVWKAVVGAFDLKNIALTYIKFIIGRISLDNKLIYVSILMPVCAYFGYFLFRGLKFASNFNRKLLLILTIVPIFLASAISIVVPIYSYFRLLFLLPIFLIIVSSGILSFKARSRHFFLIVFILIETFSSMTYLLNTTFQREDWRGLVTFLKSKNSVPVLFESSGAFSPFDYYGGKTIKGVGALKNFPARDLKDIKDLKTELGSKNDVFLIDYLVDISDPSRLVSKSLLSLGYKQMRTYNFNGVGFVYYFKKDENAQ